MMKMRMNENGMVISGLKNKIETKNKIRIALLHIHNERITTHYNRKYTSSNY